MTQAVGPDPNIPQQNASDPTRCVWVGASAGSGKTKVLTDRVLRLLLPRPADAQTVIPGTPAHRILCLTFTKAGANEMAIRVNETLGKWAVIPQEELEEQLEKLTGTPPCPEMTQAARRLFAEVVDLPGGLKIMTIHAFCQSVLARFPLEAGLPPHFTPIEDDVIQRRLKAAVDAVLTEAHMTPGTPLGEAVARIAEQYGNRREFEKTLKEIVAERLQMNRLMTRHDPHDETMRSALLSILGHEDLSDRRVTPAEIIAETMAAIDHTKLRRIGMLMREYGSETVQKAGHSLLAILSRNAPPKDWAAYKLIFLTTEDEIRKKHLTQKCQTEDPDAVDLCTEETARLVRAIDRIKALTCATITQDTLLLGKHVLGRYAAIKDANGELDHDDQIERTLDLLNRSETALRWVMYKLDRGIDHLLVDEAQDTNPEQWDIIEKLTDDFFAGEGAGASRIEEKTGGPRTLFVVGDIKQSIYSFQRAAPDRFMEMRERFAGKIAAAGQTLASEHLATSFRSSTAVLDVVDAVCANPRVARDLCEENIKHHAFFDKRAGRVELWPMITREKKEKDKKRDKSDLTWDLPTTLKSEQDPQMQLAGKIAQTIAKWLKTGERLEGQDRPIRPDDIMILVKSRGGFVAKLARALKENNVPVSGLDRMTLKNQIAVQDLLSAARFALQPEDDLALAELLKSPFAGPQAGWDDLRLYDTLHDRNGSVWATLRRTLPKDDPLIRWAGDLIASAAGETPFLFFSLLLNRPCPASQTSGLDALQRRLGQDALDPIEEFLSSILNAELGPDTLNPSLHALIAETNGSAAEIKREMQDAEGQVRIMTIHGAKGLQAPIVILPDTIHEPDTKKPARILWPDKTGLALPLLATKAQTRPQTYADAIERVIAWQDREYARQLYVAMTRAEERLYICGAQKGDKNAPRPETWYTLIRDALKNAGAAEEHDGTLIFARPQQKEKEVGESGQKAEQIDPLCPDIMDAPPLAREDLPDWVHTQPGPEPSPPRPLTPSRPSGDPPPALSPLAARSQKQSESKRFRRGLLTHKILQILPELPVQNRESAARTFLSTQAHDLPESVREEIIRESLTVLTHPDFAPLFGPGSKAEVPLTGLIDNKTLVSAQIDRLLITDDTIWILDYKTNRPPPRDPQDVPAQYLEQMRSYRDTLKAIHPRQKIICVLLWTDGPHLMPVPDALLDKIP